jgi:hypothetical protein
MTALGVLRYNVGKYWGYHLYLYGEKDLAKEAKPAQRLVYEVGEGGNNEVVATEATGASNNGFSRLEVRENININDNKSSIA